MTDKEKIKAEIERLKENGCASPIVICDTLLAFIDSLQEEPVSDDLEIAACQSFNCACEDLNKEDKDSATYVKEYFKELWMCAFKDGAHWKEQQMMKAAIDAQVVLGPNDNHVLMNGLFNNYKYHDKVKLIIIKEDCA
jgi:hypothetical protein